MNNTKMKTENQFAVLWPTKVRLPISKDTAFLLENPEVAALATQDYQPEVLLDILFELGTVADRIARIYRDIAASKGMEASNGHQELTEPNGTSAVG